MSVRRVRGSFKGSTKKFGSADSNKKTVCHSTWVYKKNEWALLYGLQSTIYYLQQELREAKDTIAKLEQDKLNLMKQRTEECNNTVDIKTEETTIPESTTMDDKSDLEVDNHQQTTGDDEQPKTPSDNDEVDIPVENSKMAAAKDGNQEFEETKPDVKENGKHSPAACEWTSVIVTSDNNKSSRKSPRNKKSNARTNDTTRRTTKKRTRAANNTDNHSDNDSETDTKRVKQEVSL